MKLSEHFTLEEMEQSSTASCLGIRNAATGAVIENLTNLCEKALEPLREHYGGPIRITSGYRCPSLNTAVGGSPTSQHMKGEAVDIVPPLHYSSLKERNKVLNEWFTWIQDNLRFDQLIREYPSRGTQAFWIHLSLRRDDSKNRQQVIIKMTKKRC